MAVAELVTKGENVGPDKRHKPLKQFNISDNGKPLSQELYRNDSAKKPVTLSDNEDGPSQAVAINNVSGAQNFTNVRISINFI